MGDTNKSVKDNKKADDKNKKLGVESGHTTPAKPKRPYSEVANSSAEEMGLLSQQMEELSSEVKSMRDSVNKIMTKDDMKMFIKTTVEEIMNEINKGIDIQIEAKLQEHSKSLNKSIETLKTEKELLRKEIQTESFSKSAGSGCTSIKHSGTNGEL